MRRHTEGSVPPLCVRASVRAHRTYSCAGRYLLISRCTTWSWRLTASTRRSVCLGTASAPPLPHRPADHDRTRLILSSARYSRLLPTRCLHPHWHHARIRTRSHAYTYCNTHARAHTPARASPHTHNNARVHVLARTHRSSSAYLIVWRGWKLPSSLRSGRSSRCPT